MQMESTRGAKAVNLVHKRLVNNSVQMESEAAVARVCQWRAVWGWRGVWDGV